MLREFEGRTHSGNKGRSALDEGPLKALLCTRVAVQHIHGQRSCATLSRAKPTHIIYIYTRKCAARNDRIRIYYVGGDDRLRGDGSRID